MDSRSRRELIDRIRREKFGIGATKSNPLAGMLHEAIVSLSAELYQKDIHFISELFQNAEDNVYAKGVTPSLELVLTRTDITGVGAPATLILFNNEVGFQPDHVEALCAVGMSTKKGKRNSGYIGEKGIGFKSVFLVSQTPYVISNGYRFRFTDEASNEAKIGYVVPEWIDKPTDADMERVYGKSKLPQTMIILPLRRDKVEPVREQLKQVAPETLLFLSKLRQVNVRQDSGGKNLCITRSDIGPPTNEVSTVNLSVGSHVNHVQEESKYFLLQQKFPVTQCVEQRKEVDNWVITIAFPLRNRINPGQLRGDIFAFLPSDFASGFPFVINADFLLVSSRETLKFDSPWNIGILSCIPAVFRMAFNFFLQKISQYSTPGTHMAAPVLAIRDAYQFVPVIPPQQPDLRKVQQRIIDDLKVDDCVLVDALAGGNQFCKPEQARLIKTAFRKILADADEERHVSFKSSTAIRNSPWRIVDGQIQEVHASTLKILGVTDMTKEEYIEYLKHGDWILSLSERLYWDVVSFVLNFCCSSDTMKAVPILKYGKEDGSIALASIEQAMDKDVEIYMSPSEQGKRLNTEWASVFKPWVSVVFMPTSTVQILKDLRQQGSHNICGILHYLDKVVSDLSIKSYLQRLMALLKTAVDPKFVLLVTEFMYQCLQGKDIEKSDCSLNPVIVVDQYSRVCRPGRFSVNILLPPHGSTWPKLSLSSWSSSTIVLSDDYVITPSAWPSSLKACISNKADPFVLHPYRSYLEDVFSASDIPHMVPVTDSAFDSPYQMPNQLRLTMTIEQAYLLLKWLTNLLNNQSDFAVSQSRFINNMKNTEWLPTEEHGLRRPSLCFDKSSFGAFFESSDVPCILPSLCLFSRALQDLGVVADNKKGCEAVINYMLEMSNDSTGGHSCTIEQATRLYRYIHKFHLTTSLLTSPEKLKIFVPRTSQYNTSNPWKDRESCVIRDVEGYFGDILTVLEGLYPLDLLPFFRRDLHVPDGATVEKYCQLWLTWRANVNEITVGECTCVWKVLSEKWADCDDNIRVDFLSKAWIPSMSENSSTIQLSSPADCFIPDNLHLQSLFDGQPGVHFVWYPDNTEKMESGMNRVYVDMKVKSLSLCVQQEFIIGADSAEDYCIQNQQTVSGKGILCAGLFRAILGFLARKKYGLASSERQRILTSLQSIQEIIITGPLTSSWTISSLSPPVVATENYVMALWSTKDRKFYCLDKENPILRNCLAMRHFRSQVSTAISCGLLSEHPSVADELSEFMNVLICSGFETSHVEYELRRKNAKLFEEDELFLSQLLNLKGEVQFVDP